MTVASYPIAVLETNRQIHCASCGAPLLTVAGFCQSCGAHTAPGRATVSDTPTRQPQAYAGFWWRALAMFIDGFVTQIGSVAIAFPIGLSLTQSMATTASPREIATAGQFLGVFIALAVSWLYYTILESSPWQATIGKKIRGLRVATDQGTRLTFGNANSRYWSKLISALTLGVGYVMVALTEKKQALHDKIAGTLVLRLQPTT